MQPTFTSEFTKKNAALVVILAGFGIVENVIQSDFVCPCESPDKEIFCGMYLVLPAFIAFTVTYCILYQLKKEEARRVSPGFNCLHCWICLVPVLAWLLVYLADGRYVACWATTLEKGDSVSTSKLPWEWCDKNRTLTEKQKNARNAYFLSKVRDRSYTTLKTFS